MADEPENGVIQEGDDKEDLYLEPKPKPKIVRVLTVLAYILSVSMAAILLSIYYVFMWDGQPTLARRTDPSMQHRIGLPDYDYPDIYHQDVENATNADYNVTEILLNKDQSSIESISLENFTNNLNIYNHTPLSIDNINEINIIKKENETSNNSDRSLSSLTESYDINPVSSPITSTEDNLSGANYEDSNLADVKSSPSAPIVYRRPSGEEIIISEE